MEAIQVQTERLDGVSDRVTRLEATSGKLVLGPAMLALLWAIVVAVIAAAGSTAVAAYQASEATQAVRVLTDQVNAHAALPWHAADGHREDEIDKRLDRVEHWQETHNGH